MTVKNGVILLPDLVIHVEDIRKAKFRPEDMEIFVKDSSGFSKIPVRSAEHAQEILQEIYGAMVAETETTTQLADEPRTHVLSRILDEVRRDPKLRILYVSCRQDPRFIAQELVNKARASNLNFKASWPSPGRDYAQVSLWGSTEFNPTVRVVEPGGLLPRDRVDVVVFDSWVNIPALGSWRRAVENKAAAVWSV